MTKVTVDHDGYCDGFHYQKGVPVELPENVLKALGSHTQLLGEDKPVKKEVKKPLNTMTQKAKVITKDVEQEKEVVQEENI